MWGRGFGDGELEFWGCVGELLRFGRGEGRVC